MKLFRRHLRLFSSDPVNWIVSLLSVAVILGLYFLFIRDFTIKAIQDIGFFHHDIEQFVDLLMVSGLLVVIAATTCLPICSIAVKDRERLIRQDFEVSPISRFAIHSSYIAASVIISFLLTTLAFLVILIYFRSLYEYRLNIVQLSQCLLLILVSGILSSLLLYLIALPFRSMTSFASFGNLFGVMIGFLTGVYIPVGYYPQLIQNGLFLFPLSQTTSLLRNIMADAPLLSMTTDFPESARQTIEKMFGLTVTINDQLWNSQSQILYLLIVVFLAVLFLAVLAMRKK